MDLVFCLLLTFGLFHFSEGKPCPEEYRPHKTRCDAYFKCTLLPSKAHVWVPEKCDRGLVFEPNLKLCVLPGEDWECNLGEPSLTKVNLDENNIYGVDVLNIKSEKPPNNYLKTNIYKSPQKIENSIKLTEFIEVNNSLDNLKEEKLNIINENNDDDSLESSGDGQIEILEDGDRVELRENHDKIDLPLSTTTQVDPKLTSHLQRLSQLIDGLKQTYQSKDTHTTDLRPDQLNAFLAHFNIKNEFDALVPDKSTQQFESIPKRNEQIVNQNNFTNINENNVRTKMNTLNPETKVLLKNSGFQRYNNYDSSDYTKGYSNSQIVVNRPEGSVLFSLGSTKPQELSNHKNKDNYYDYNSEPRISEETLKTVLELSKQMVANQNIRQILPNTGAFYQPFMQPMYYPVAVAPYQHNSFSSPDDSKYSSKFSSNNRHYESNDKTSSSVYTSSSQNSREPTTIIQNSVIPVHITTNSESGIIEKPSDTSTVENEKYDSYGNQITETKFLDYVEYPPFYKKQSSNSESEFTDQTQKQFYRVPTLKATTTTTTTTELPQKLTTNRLSLLSFYTPNPHLDNSNANTIFESGNEDRYPILTNYQLPNRIDQSSTPQKINQFYSNQYQQKTNAILNRDQIPYHIHNKIPSVMQQQFNVNSGSNSNSGYGTDVEQMNEYQNNLSENYDKNSYSSNSNSMMDGSVNEQNQKFVTNHLSQPNVDQHNSYNNNNHYASSSNGLLNGYGEMSAGNTLVNLGGSFINFDVYKNKLLPALQNGISTNQMYEPNVEVVTCNAGIRQPNFTDCTKYYVCSRKDSKILTYSCPPFTGFNSESRICDAKTYTLCNPNAVFTRFTVAENRKIQLQALKALQDAKRIRNEAFQAQNLANLIRLETEKAINNSYVPNESSQQYYQNPTILSNYMQSFTSSESSAGFDVVTQITSTTLKPSNNGVIQRKRKYFCKDGDKIADQTSNLNYYVCYKTKDGIMHGHKMTCSPGLMFCARTRLCTLPKMCNL